MIEMFKAGGPVMWPLLLCSIVSLAVMIERVVFWLGINVDDNQEEIEHLLDCCLAGREPDGLVGAQVKSKKRSLVVKMLLSGLAHRNFSCLKAMETVALDELKKMRKYMGVLDTIITIAPMLGILGTVTGIINSFDMLGASTIDDPKNVVAGIAQALITTAAGLVISIATVFPYNYFNSRLEDAEDKFENYATRLEILQTKVAGENGGRGAKGL